MLSDNLFTIARKIQNGPSARDVGNSFAETENVFQILGRYFPRFLYYALCNGHFEGLIVDQDRDLIRKAWIWEILGTQNLTQGKNCT
jgi:hypothetical protein